MDSKRNGLSYKEAGLLGHYASKATIEKKKSIRKETYYNNPKYCENCGKVIPYENRYNKFCNSSCSASYNNKMRGRMSDETKIKISNSLILKKIKKPKICKYCGAIKGTCNDPYVCSKHKLFSSLQQFGLDITAVGSENIISEFYKAKKNIERFYLIYSTNNEELIKQFNYKSGAANFSKILKSLNISKRTLSESLILAWSSGRTTISCDYKSNYKSGWHTTWNGKDIYYRSSYELDYAKYLDEQNIDYEVESLRIKYFDSQTNNYRCAIPDFYIPSTNEIIEIKGLYTLNVQNMKDKFERYKQLGYYPKLILEHKEVNINEL